jgi:hypothetical protein
MGNWQRHVTVLGALRIGFAVLGLLVAGLVFVVVVGGGLLSGDQEAIAVTGTVGTLIAGFIAVFSLPGLVAGIGLLRWSPWARMLNMILALFDLLLVPIGTLFAVYTFWVLLQDEVEKLFVAGGPH